MCSTCRCYCHAICGKTKEDEEGYGGPCMAATRSVCGPPGKSVHSASVVVSMDHLVELTN